MELNTSADLSIGNDSDYSVESEGSLFVWKARNVCVSASEALLHQFVTYAPILYIMQLIAAFNLITNGFAYLIFSRYRHRTVLVCLLMALSLGEVFYQIFYILNVSNDMLVLSWTLRFDAMAKAKAYAYFFNFAVTVLLSTCHIFRNWVVVLISAYRFEVVCRALSSRFVVFATARRTVWICVGTAVLAGACSLPRYTERNATLCRSLEDGPDGDSGVVIAGFYDRMSQVYLKVYYSAVLFVLQSGGPTTCVFILSLFILVRLAKRQRYKQSLQRYAPPPPPPQAPSNANGAKPFPSAVDGDSPNAPCRQHSNNQQQQQLRRRKERDGGSLVIALCSLFFIFEMPVFISKVARACEISNGRLDIAANFATLLDSASNFLVYLASNRLFRQNALAFVTCGSHLGGARSQAGTSMQSATMMRTTPTVAARGDGPVQRKTDRMPLNLL